MRKGFSLVELMVASLLLGILVTILTMIFNQSSVAWRTGTAGVAQLQDTRRELGVFHDIRDDALPGLKEKDKTGTSRGVQYRTVSVFTDSNTLRSGRAFDQIVWNGAPTINAADTQNGTTYQLSGGQTAGSATFTVGVRSAGPNGVFGDEDDITTWPDEVF